jgi:thiamine kinase-like enzyme
MAESIFRIKKAVNGIKSRQLGLSGPIRIQSVQAIKSGETHYNYLLIINGRKFLLRLTSVRKDSRGKNSWGAARINVEFDGIKSIEKLGIAPKVYYKDTSCRVLSKPFVISDYVPGEPVTRMTEKDLKSLALLLAELHRIHNVKRMTEKDLKSLAFLLAELHRIHNVNGLRNEPVKDYNREYIKKRVDRITDTGFKYVNSHFKADLMEAYKKIKHIRLKRQKLSVIHGDISKDNLLRTENGLKLIDWESVRLSEPQFEIATALERLNLNGQKRKLFLSEYLKHSEKASLEELEEYEKIRCFDRLLWSIFEFVKLKEGITEKEKARQKSPLKYARNAHKEFLRCKSLDLFPKESVFIILSNPKV